jgi:hypothetical protein
MKVNPDIDIVGILNEIDYLIDCLTYDQFEKKCDNTAEIARFQNSEN